MWAILHDANIVRTSYMKSLQSVFYILMYYFWTSCSNFSCWNKTFILQVPQKLKIQFTLGHLQNYPQASFNVHLQKLHGFSFNSELCDLAEKYGALTFIDECHATGFLGDTGR